jgi:hypothetical protein
MRTCWQIPLAAAAASLLAGGAFAAQPPTPADLKPCAFTLPEVAAALGAEVKQAAAADMTITVGRDVGCLYFVKGSDFVFGVRQVWDSTRPAKAGSAGAPRGYRAIPGDPDGAVVQSASGGGAGSGELVYVRGKVETHIFWHGGNLSSADGLQRLLSMRRVP